LGRVLDERVPRKGTSQFNQTDSAQPEDGIERVEKKIYGGKGKA